MNDSGRTDAGAEGIVRAAGHYLNNERVSLWGIEGEGMVKVLVLTGPNGTKVAPEAIPSTDVEWASGGDEITALTETGNHMADGDTELDAGDRAAVYRLAVGAGLVPSTVRAARSAAGRQNGLGARHGEVPVHAATVETAAAQATGEPAGDGLAGLDLDGLTSYTVGIIRRAHAAGLRPAWGTPRGKARRVTLNGPGPHSPFGSITIGVTSGKVLRAEIIYGNDPDAVRTVVQGANAVRDLVATLSPSRCPEGCTAVNAIVCSHR